MKKVNIKWLVLGFIIPLIEILIYILIFNGHFIILLILLLSFIISLIISNNKDKKKKSIGIGMLISFIINIIFIFIGWPTIQKMVVQKTCDTYGEGYKAVRNKSSSGSDWMCEKENGDAIIPRTNNE